MTVVTTTVNVTHGTQAPGRRNSSLRHDPSSSAGWITTREFGMTPSILIKCSCVFGRTYKEILDVVIRAPKSKEQVWRQKGMIRCLRKLPDLSSGTTPRGVEHHVLVGGTRVARAKGLHKLHQPTATPIGEILTEYVEPFEFVHNALLHAPFSTKGMSSWQSLPVTCASHL